MTHLDEIIQNALAGLPETDVAILAREVVRLREARAVVVPAWDVNAFALACVKVGAYAEGDLRDALKNAETGYNFAISSVRAIPAHRVLGEGMVAARWIPVSESLPEDGESVGFVINSTHDEWNHGRAVGGRFNRKHFDKGFGGFSFPGIEWAASHWCKLPPILDALRANQGGACHD